jgi:hypothetical protein
MSKVVVVEIRRQLAEIKVIQPLNAIIPTMRVETIVAPNTNFVRGGVLIGSIVNLGHGSRRVSTRRNLNRSLGLLTTIRVVGTPQMVFTNPIMIIRVNMIIYQPPMSSIVVGRYKSTNVGNPRGGYGEPFGCKQNKVNNLITLSKLEQVDLK